MKKIGLTTTVPIEVLLAAGYRPVDLNNLFVTSENYLSYIEMAENDGFPKSLCAWIKGIYGACIANNITEVVGVTEGDCSNTCGLLEVLKLRGIKIIPFGFPHDHSFESVKDSLQRFMTALNVRDVQVESVRDRLNKIRLIASEIDALTYKEGKVSGFENHLLQLCMSDFNMDPNEYESFLIKNLNTFKQREGDLKKLRIAYIGVPPMTGDLFDYVENKGARIIYNEVQREFAFPRANSCQNIYEQYHNYTYPYNLDFRIEEILKQLEQRNIQGVIHYTQAFCHKAIDDIVLRSKIKLPILTLEGDISNKMDARTQLRVEAFLDMIREIEGV